jgi:hypothetical protein
MTDTRLPVRNRELFLAEPHIAALPVSAAPGRGPLTVPVWYQYAPGGEAWVLTGHPSPRTQAATAVTNHRTRTYSAASAVPGQALDLAPRWLPFAPTRRGVPPKEPGAR